MIVAHLLCGVFDRHRRRAGDRVGHHQRFDLHAGQVEVAQRVFGFCFATAVKETAKRFIVSAQLVEQPRWDADQACILLRVRGCDGAPVFQQATLTK